MTDTLTTMRGAQVLVCAPEGAKIASERDALDVLVAAMEQGAEWVVVPVDRLGADFFQLKTGLAGQILQKFVMYRRRLVILGDVSGYEAESQAFRGLVYESNRGTDAWFLADLSELDERLHRWQEQQA